MTRQQKRQAERRAKKPEPATIERTTWRRHARTKGQAFSRMALKSVTPPEKGKPAVFNLIHPTRASRQSVVATPQNLGLFVTGLTVEMQSHMLGY